jgi:hypothetical protein
LLSAVPPHRLAGGVGLLLIGAGIVAVKFPPARHTAASAAAAGAASSPADRGTADRRQQPAQNGGGADSGGGGGGDGESEVTYRGFSLATDSLPPFRVTDLSVPLGEGEQFDVIALDQNGAVLGTVLPPRKNSVLPRAKRLAPRTFAARWHKGVLRRLPIPPGADRVVAGDMNDRGDVGAVSIRYRRGKPSFNRVLLYDGGAAAAAYQDLGTLDPEFSQQDTSDAVKMRGVSENILCLNNRGTLVALVGDKTWFRRSDGFKGPFSEAVAFDLNNHDTAVGFMGTFATGAVMWRNVTVPQKFSMTPLLPTRGNGPQSGQSNWRGSAECVNDKGDAVVSVPLDSSRGFRRLAHTAYYLLRGGKLQLIAQTRGYHRARARINDSGDVVGFADTDMQTQITSPLLYRNGKMYDLTHAARNAGWKILGAVDINNSRQILAYGIRTDRENVAVPILLSPVRD